MRLWFSLTLGALVDLVTVQMCEQMFVMSVIGDPCIVSSCLKVLSIMSHPSQTLTRGMNILLYTVTLPVIVLFSRPAIVRAKLYFGLFLSRIMIVTLLTVHNSVKGKG